jgi:hypothetical protein
MWRTTENAPRASLRTKHELVTSELCTLFFMGYHHNLPNYEPPGRQYHNQAHHLKTTPPAEINASFELSKLGFRKRSEEFVVYSFQISFFPNLQVHFFISNKAFSLGTLRVPSLVCEVRASPSMGLRCSSASLSPRSSCL